MNQFTVAERLEVIRGRVSFFNKEKWNSWTEAIPSIAHSPTQNFAMFFITFNAPVRF